MFLISGGIENIEVPLVTLETKISNNKILTHSKVLNRLPSAS